MSSFHKRCLFSICFYSKGSVANMARYMWGANFCATVTTILAICVTLPEAQQTQTIESVIGCKFGHQVTLTVGCKFDHQMALLALIANLAISFIGSKFGQEMGPLALPHCLVLSFWLHQLVIELVSSSASVTPVKSPIVLLTYSHHGEILSWSDFACRPWCWW